MSLRPRYSLLTLLLLTALVAGGVKLWYGPHHVVEQATPNEEVEYHFTRNWQGEKIIQGPHVSRILKMPNGFPAVIVRYYRAGERLPWNYECTVSQYFGYYRRGSLPQSPLRPDEELEFQQYIDREKQRLFGPDLKLLETYDHTYQQFP